MNHPLPAHEWDSHHLSPHLNKSQAYDSPRPLGEKGIYIAPSPYETGFLSLADTETDIDDTLTVFEEALRDI